jgi:hypothetical protein
MKLQEKMFALVQAWQESGMVRQEFLSDKTISLSKFNYWLYKYRKSQQKHPQNLPVRSTPGDFKSFVLSDEAIETSGQSVSMEITTPSGVRITIYN